MPWQLLLKPGPHRILDTCLCNRRPVSAIPTWLVDICCRLLYMPPSWQGPRVLSANPGCYMQSLGAKCSALQCAPAGGVQQCDAQRWRSDQPARPAAHSGKAICNPSESRKLRPSRTDSYRGQLTRCVSAMEKFWEGDRCWGANPGVGGPWGVAVGGRGGKGPGGSFAGGA